MQADGQGVPEVLELLATDLDSHFHYLVLSFQQRLYTFALRQSGSPQDAEDIVQETFIRAYHALADYPPERIRAMKIQAWLYKIALNVFYRQRGGSQAQSVSLDQPDASEILLALPDDDRLQPEHIFEGRESLRELERLISHVPASYRLAVSCYYLEELSYREIAELLNQPIGTVKGNIYRGTQFLRNALSTYRDESLRLT